MAAITELLENGFSIQRESQKTYPDTSMTPGTEVVTTDQTIITVNQRHTFSTSRTFESTVSSTNNHITNTANPRMYAPSESMDEVESVEYLAILTELTTLRDAIKVVVG